MLCDRFLEIPWLNKAEEDKLEARIEGLRKETADYSIEGDDGLSLQELKHRESKLEEHIRLIRERRATLASIRDGKILSLTDRSINYSEVNSLKAKIKDAQKFSLTLDFVESTLEKLATPATVVKSRDLFHLPYNPMWVEWSGYLKSEQGQAIPGESYTRGILLEQGEESGVVMTMISMVKGVAAIERSRFYPNTLRIEDGTLTIDWEDSLPTEESTNKWELAVTDFIIRINSPRITETRPCEDQSAINKKRVKNGKLPLFSYVVVDLNKKVKDSLKLAKIGEGEGVRFHWRRGHFKCTKNGIFWWNPHTAGRKELGIIEKEYAA